MLSDRGAADELPVYGMVGQMLAPDAASKSAPKPFLYTHKTFSIAYNKDQIIELNLTSDAPVYARTLTPVLHSAHARPTPQADHARGHDHFHLLCEVVVHHS